MDRFWRVCPDNQVCEPKSYYGSAHKFGSGGGGEDDDVPVAPEDFDPDIKSDVKHDDSHPDHVTGPSVKHSLWNSMGRLKLDDYPPLPHSRDWSYKAKLDDYPPLLYPRDQPFGAAPNDYPSTTYITGRPWYRMSGQTIGAGSAIESAYVQEDSKVPIIDPIKITIPLKVKDDSPAVVEPKPVFKYKKYTTYETKPEIRMVPVVKTILRPVNVGPDQIVDEQGQRVAKDFDVKKL